MTGLIATETQFGSEERLRGNDQELRESIRAVVSRGAASLTFRSVTGNETLDHRFNTFSFSTLGGAITAFLPPTTTWGSSKSTHLTLINSAGSNNVTLTCHTTDIFDTGISTYTLRPGEKIVIIGDPSALVWFVFSPSLSPSWTAPSFTNSWVDYGAPYDTAGYLKTQDNWVKLKGLVKNGTLSTSAFTLPVGYRPAAYKQFATVANGAFGLIEIATTGTVTLYVTSNASVSLEGISFRTI